MYDKYIANAAREYHGLREMKIQNQEEQVKAYAKLVWMINAEKYGWNPQMYNETNTNDSK